MSTLLRKLIAPLGSALCSALFAESTFSQDHEWTKLFEKEVFRAATLITDATGDGIGDIAAVVSEDAGSNPALVALYSGKDGALVYNCEIGGWSVDCDWAVYSAGDLDKDGRGDFVVSRWSDSEPPADSITGMDVISGADGSVFRRIPRNRVGLRVAGLGDTDGDSYLEYAFVDDSAGDFLRLVCASGKTGRQVWQREFPKVVSDPASSSAVNVYQGEWTCVRNGGDWNGDGIDDVIFAGPAAQLSKHIETCIYVLSGINGNELFKLPSQAHELPEAVAGLRGFAGDGMPGLVIGQPSMSECMMYAPGASLRVWTRSGDHADDSFGWAVCVLGDMDGDGTGDCALAAPRLHAGEGAAYIRIVSGRTGTLLMSLSGDVEMQGAEMALPGRPYAYGWSMSYSDGSRADKRFLVVERRLMNMTRRTRDRCAVYGLATK